METFEEGAHQGGNSPCVTKTVFGLVFMAGPGTHLGTGEKGKGDGVPFPEASPWVWEVGA